MFHNESWKLIYFGGKGQGHESQKHCWHESLHSCECWVLSSCSHCSNVHLLWCVFDSQRAWHQFLTPFSLVFVFHSYTPTSGIFLLHLFQTYASCRNWPKLFIFSLKITPPPPCFALCVTRTCAFIVLNCLIQLLYLTCLNRLSHQTHWFLSQQFSALCIFRPRRIHPIHRCSLWLQMSWCKRQVVSGALSRCKRQIVSGALSWCRRQIVSGALSWCKRQVVSGAFNCFVVMQEADCKWCFIVEADCKWCFIVMQEADCKWCFIVLQECQRFEPWWTRVGTAICQSWTFCCVKHWSPSTWAGCVTPWHCMMPICSIDLSATHSMSPSGHCCLEAAVRKRLLSQHRIHLNRKVCHFHTHCCNFIVIQSVYACMCVCRVCAESFFFGLLFDRVDLIKLVSNVCPWIHPSVRCPSTKRFFDFNEIWHVGGGQWLMHDGMQYDRSKVNVKVTNPSELEILPFSKAISSAIYNGSWQLTTVS